MILDSLDYPAHIVESGITSRGDQWCVLRTIADMYTDRGAWLIIKAPNPGGYDMYQIKRADLDDIGNVDNLNITPKYLWDAAFMINQWSRSYIDSHWKELKESKLMKMNTNKNENLTRAQDDAMIRYGWVANDVIGDGVAVCEVSHPNGSASVYISRDGSIHVEEGDDLDGYELVPLADSFLSDILSD